MLFLIYINDLLVAFSLLSSLFADDTKLFASGPDIHALTAFVNEEFQKVVQYLRFHKMALHPSKTQFLLFSNSTAVKNNPPEIYINNNDIGALPDPTKIIQIPNVNLNSETLAIKFLGLYFYASLNFKFYINFIMKKLSRALFFMRTAKNN
jgi:hypothetical protein